jgi:eukaryotic-like serine/threonine-protein kinase
MPDQQRILHLVEEVLNSDSSPEEVCANDIDLLPEVKARVDHCRGVDAEIHAMFPPSSVRSLAERRPLDLLTGCPDIPGYKVESILGRGGMGIVYKATHLRLNRPVALKMLLSGDFASANELTRFMREAQSVAALHHAHIVQIHDEGTLDGRPYYTMEFVEGGSLAQKLAGVPQSPRYAAELVHALAGAVDTAHQAGIIHRDLKPSNILLMLDSTPKITDFGLARRMDGDPALTNSEARVGTPSYMSPEQASGTADGFCPATDIYSLGAILYEMLSGRPPFKGETASETERQVITAEPVPPSRLNPKVPKDLETICLTCLQKNPSRRYKTAAALADDLLRFLHGEPISARPVGFLERSMKWARRHPATVVGLAAGFVLVLILTIGLTSAEIQRSQRDRAIELDLSQMTNLQERAQWDDAEKSILSAEARLNGGGSAAVRQRVEQAHRDLKLVIRLDNIRLSRVTNGRLVFYRQKATHDYAGAFEDAGLTPFTTNADDVENRIRNSLVRDAFVAALDDWATYTAKPDQRSWLLEVARKADIDRGGWSDRIRDPATWTDRGAVQSLANDVPMKGQSVSLLLALAERLRNTNGDAKRFLKRVQNEHPDDFWANLVLGDAMLIQKPEEAETYYRAALASRPDAAVCYSAIGDSLRQQKLPAEAIAYYQQALTHNHRYARAATNLGNAFNDQGHLKEALACYEQALEFDLNYAWAHNDLGRALYNAGRTNEAIAQYRQCISLDPSIPEPYSDLGDALKKIKQYDEAISCYRTALEGTPSSQWAHMQLGNTLILAGRTQEAIDFYRQFITLHPQYAWAHTDLGNVLRDSGRVDEAIDCYHQAMKMNPAYAWTYADLGRALQTKLQFDDAIACYQQYLRIDPDNAQVQNYLRTALFKTGRNEEAWTTWQLSLLQPKTQGFDAWTGYPELCLFLRHEDAYRTARTAMLDRFAKTANPVDAEETARACLLLPASDDEMKIADDLIARALGTTALKGGTSYRYFLFAKGLEEYRRGHWDEAIRIMSGEAAAALKPCPRIIIAMAQQQKGATAEAHATLAAAIQEFDWSPANADRRDIWIRHILRREAETVINPLAGASSPKALSQAK